MQSSNQLKGGPARVAPSFEVWVGEASLWVPLCQTLGLYGFVVYRVEDLGCACSKRVYIDRDR